MKDALSLILAGAGVGVIAMLYLFLMCFLHTGAEAFTAVERFFNDPLVKVNFGNITVTDNRPRERQ